jgi:hypothetical protein
MLTVGISYAVSTRSTFRLTDENGKPLSRTAQKGNYFKIDLPGPGTMEGPGYDWVCIESIEDLSDPDSTKERIAITVRPAPSPERMGENVAHFFDQHATSSFVLTREGSEVKAAVYGRNELPNTGTTQPVDKVRNAVVGRFRYSWFFRYPMEKPCKGITPHLNHCRKRSYNRTALYSRQKKYEFFRNNSCFSHVHAVTFDTKTFVHE